MSAVSVVIPGAGSAARSEGQPVWATAAVCAILAGFVLLGSLWIAYPGLQYDECLFIFGTYPRNDFPVAYALHIGKKPISLMILPYLGALKGWLYRPILAFAPGAAATVRLPALLIGALGLWCFHSLLRRTLGRQAALAALVLAGTDPIYLLTTRLDWGPVAIQHFCLLAGCLMVARWWQKDRNRYLAAGFFLFGAGVFDKAIFLWLLAALAASVLFVFTGELRKRFSVRPAATALLFLIAGASPFLYYNWKWPGEAVRRSPAGWTADYGEKFRFVEYTLQGTIVNQWLSRPAEGPPIPAGSRLASFLYAAAPSEPAAQTLLLPAILLTCLLFPLVPFRPCGRAMLFALLVCVFGFAVTLPLRNAGWAHHLALLLPFPQLFVAAGLIGAKDRLGRFFAAHPRRAVLNRLAAAALTLIVVIVAASNLRVVLQYYYLIVGYGGNSSWSEAIYSLDRDLEKARPPKIVLLDWGMLTQLRLLSRDRLPVVEMALLRNTPRDEEYMDTFVSESALYVRRAPGETVTFAGNLEKFEDHLARRGRRLEKVRAIRDRGNRPIFEIVRIVQLPQAP